MTEAPLNPDTRKHLKTLAAEAKRLLEEPGLDQVHTFVSGFASGLAVAARVLDGDTPDQAMDFFEGQVHAAVGKAYLDGKLPAPDSA